MVDLTKVKIDKVVSVKFVDKRTGETIADMMVCAERVAIDGGLHE